MNNNVYAHQMISYLSEHNISIDNLMRDEDGDMLDDSLYHTNVCACCVELFVYNLYNVLDYINY